MKVTFTAGQRVQTNGTADFFRLLSTVGPVTVEFYYQGREIAERVDVEAGFAEQFRTVQFDRVDITSATAQLVQWETALGSEIRYDRGAASITGTVALDSATLAALEQINNRPEVPTGSFGDGAAMTLNVPITVFTPAANTNGAILLSASISLVIGAQITTQTFLSKASPPASVVDGQVLLMNVHGGIISGSNYSSGANLPMPQFIPAGHGLYFISEANTPVTTATYRAARYRLL